MILVALRDIQKAGWTGLVKVERCWREQVLFNLPRHRLVKSLLIFQTTNSCFGMNLNPLLCGMFFLSKFDLLCCSVCLLILVLPAIGWSRQTGFRRWWRMQTTTREWQRINIKKTESDTKHKTTRVWHKTQCIRRPKNDTDLVIQLTRTSNYIVCLKYKTAQPKSDVVNV